MPVWKNPCLLCGCGISVYWPNCTCECHKNKMGTVIAWNNETEEPAPAPEKEAAPSTEAKADKS